MSDYTIKGGNLFFNNKAKHCPFKQPIATQTKIGGINFAQFACGDSCALWHEPSPGVVTLRCTTPQTSITAEVVAPENIPAPLVRAN